MISVAYVVSRMMEIFPIFSAALGGTVSAIIDASSGVEPLYLYERLQYIMASSTICILHAYFRA